MRKTKKINLINIGKPIKKRRLKNTKYNNGPLKGINVVRVNSKNTFNVSLAPTKRKPKPMYKIMKKESIKQPALTKWGDADMDGTSNFLDCSPRDISNDGFFGDALSAIKNKVFGPPKYERDISKKYKKISDEMVIHPDERAALTGERNAAADIREKEYVENRAASGYDTTDEQKKQIRTYTKRRFNLSKQMEKEIKEKKEEVSRDKTNAIKEALGINAFKKSTRLNKSGNFTKNSMERQKRASRTMLNVVDAFMPYGAEKIEGARARYGSKKSNKKNGPKRPVGRPKGSFKHRIPGRGLVSGEEYDAWEKKQKIRGQVGTINGPKPIYRQSSTPQVMTAKPMAQESQTVKQPGRRVTTDAYLAAVKERQMQEQKNDNVLHVERLHAPNVMKGEMVGGAPQDNILNAPNINEGGLRNVQGEKVHEIELGDRPQTNPYGDEYIEIEPGSGRRIIRRRINEKWATGEAL